MNARIPVNQCRRGFCLAAVVSAVAFAVHGQPANPPASTAFSWASEVLKLTRAGVDDVVVLAYVDNTEGTFNLDANAIISLRQGGVSGQVITAMLNHDEAILSGARTVMAATYSSQPATTHITFVPGPVAPASTTSSTQEPSKPALSNSPTESGSPVFTAEPGLAFDAFAWNSPRSPGVYPVREPYPEEICAPILVTRAWGPAPNTFILEFSP